MGIRISSLKLSRYLDARTGRSPVLASAATWRRMRFLAHGYSVCSEEDPYGNTHHHHAPRLHWERRIFFDPPVKAGVVIIHPDAPDCEVLLKITLSTSPNLTSHWRIKSKWFGGFPSGDRL